MPFPQQTPHGYTKAAVESLNPNQNGCYGIFRGSTCVYVGRGDIRTRMLAHIGGDNSCITTQAPNQWYSMVTQNDEAAEKALILEFKPICNQQVG